MRKRGEGESMGRWDTSDRNYDLSTLGQVGKDLERDLQGG